MSSSIGLLGRKVGMTCIYDDKGRATAVTVIDAGGNAVLQVKTPDNDGYAAVQVGFGDQIERRDTKARAGHAKKAGSGSKRFVREFRLKAGESAPETGPLALSVFEAGQAVDVIGQSKGKGFQGVVKRFHFAGQPASHGSMMHRRNGAIGNRSTPGRVWKNMGMPGHMGDRRTTVQNLAILQVRADEGILLVKGAVPGANGTFVIVRPAKKAKPARKAEPAKK